MTSKNLEIISQIVLWYENSFRIDWHGIEHFIYHNYSKHSNETYTYVFNAVVHNKKKKEKRRLNF